MSAARAISSTRRTSGRSTAFYRAPGLCAVVDPGRQADRARAGGHCPHQGGRHRRPRPVRLSRAARPDRRRHAGHADRSGARRGDAQPGGHRLCPRRPFRPSRPRRHQPELRLQAARRRSGRGAQQDLHGRRRGQGAGLLQSAAPRIPGAAREARRSPGRREQPAAGHPRRPQPQARHEGPARRHPARAPEDRAAAPRRSKRPWRRHRPPMRRLPPTPRHCRPAAGVSAGRRHGDAGLGDHRPARRHAAEATPAIDKTVVAATEPTRQAVRSGGLRRQRSMPRSRRSRNPPA